MTTKLPSDAHALRGRFPDDIHYPDSDDEPLPNGRYQEPYFIEIVGTVREHFRDRADVEVSGNTFIYYEEGNPRRFISPDLHVTLDVTAEGFASMDYRNTYLVWEIGKPADFVLEIASESTARRDVTEKRVLYAQIGFGEYWRFDGSGGDFYGEPLVGEYLAGGEYRRFDVVPDAEGRPHGYSPALALWLYWDDGQLRFYDQAAGEWLRSRTEERAAADEARAAADQARAAADQERAAADQARAVADQARATADQERAARQLAEAQVAELQAELRRLRGDSA